MFSNQHSIRGQVVLRSMGIGSIPVVNVENACAGASTALYLAIMGIKAGMYDCALAVGSEKITHEDKTVSLMAYASCMDVENFDMQLKLFEELNKSLNFQIPEDGPPGQGRSVFMDAYAMGARWHMKKNLALPKGNLHTLPQKKSFSCIFKSPCPISKSNDSGRGIK